MTTSPDTTMIEDLVSEVAYDPYGALETKAEEVQAALEADPLGRTEDVPDFEPTIGESGAVHATEIVVDDRPAEERIAELFKRMKPRRRQLMGILALCDGDPVPVEEVYARVDELQAAHRSVYSGEALCNLLVRSGALESIEPEEQEPETEVVDGVEYLKPAAPKEVMYKTTEAGRAVLADDSPEDRVLAALEKEPQYKPVYLQILCACAEEGGKTAKELGALVDHDPLLQEPRRWAAYFFGILDDADALTWDKTWKTTEVGYIAIERLQAEGISY